MKRLEEMTNEELWQLFPICLRPHDPAWANWYAAERALLEGALGPADAAGDIVRLSHVGSTAVPRLTAKPTVDLLLEVAPGCRLEPLRRRLAGAGYLLIDRPGSPAPGLMGMKGYTPQGFAPPVFHLHVRFPGDWPEPYFRDWLMAHPADADAYAALKTKLMARHQHDRDAYTDAKAEFVRRCSQQAMAAWPGRHAPPQTAVRAITRRGPRMLERLVAVWESSVRATHTFLPAGAIEAMRPEVRQGAAQIEHLWGYFDPAGALLGFVGVQGEKIEMLFVDAAARGRGVGGALLRCATDALGARRVDVNEQNTAGAEFYAHMGFEVAGRSPLDERGRPYPILHLERAPV